MSLKLVPEGPNDKKSIHWRICICLWDMNHKMHRFVRHAPCTLSLVWYLIGHQDFMYFFKPQKWILKMNKIECTDYESWVMLFFSLRNTYSFLTSVYWCMLNCISLNSARHTLCPWLYYTIPVDFIDILHGHFASTGTMVPLPLLPVKQPWRILVNYSVIHFRLWITKHNKTMHNLWDISVSGVPHIHSKSDGRNAKKLGHPIIWLIIGDGDSTSVYNDTNP